MAEVSPELRAKVKKLAREYMEAPRGAKLLKAKEAGDLMKAAGIEEEVAVAFWYSLSVEILEEALGEKLPVPEAS